MYYIRLAKQESVRNQKDLGEACREAVRCRASHKTAVYVLYTACQAGIGEIPKGSRRRESEPILLVNIFGITKRHLVQSEFGA